MSKNVLVIVFVIILSLLSSTASGQMKKVVRQKQVSKQQVSVTTEKSSGSQYSFQSIRWVGPFKEGLSRVESNSMRPFGFVDKTGKIVIRRPPQVYLFSDFSDGYAIVYDKKVNYGYIDKTGRVVIACRWKYAEDFSEGLAMVKDANDKYGFIDKTGKLVIPCQWNAARDFSEGLAVVRDDHDNFFCIDKTGKEVFRFERCWGSDWPTDFHEGVVTHLGKFIDKNGTVIPCQWKAMSGFSEGMAMVMDENKKCGFVDKTFKLVIPCKWEYNSEMVFRNGRAQVSGDDGKHGYIDNTGKLAISCKWIVAENFSEGLAIVKDNDNRCGFIDTHSNVVIPCKWKNAFPFSEGLAWVLDSHDNWHIIDKNGKIVK